MKRFTFIGVIAVCLALAGLSQAVSGQGGGVWGGAPPVSSPDRHTDGVASGVSRRAAGRGREVLSYQRSPECGSWSEFLDSEHDPYATLGSEPSTADSESRCLATRLSLRRDLQRGVALLAT
jgi:hypothetical protein